jgi:hypothetical protein
MLVDNVMALLNRQKTPDRQDHQVEILRSNLSRRVVKFTTKKLEFLENAVKCVEL